MMSLRVLFGIFGFVAGSTVPLFDFEKIQLRRDAHLPESTVGPNDVSPPPGFAERKCKPFPGDADWPGDEVWKEFNKTISGALLKPAPAASVCYNGTEYGNFAAAECSALTARWGDDFVRMEHPIEVISPLSEGLTCLPPASFNTSGCTQGGYPVYVVNVGTVAQVQAAVNFARTSGVRLVIKNTGHEFTGRSLGAGSLSIWTHGLKDLEFVENFTTTGYSGPAFQVGAGVQGAEILKAARDKGVMVVTGICDSVGIFGGYSQGGGHSPLSALHGLGADQILSLRVVTADGEFRTASPTENPDLFWAIRGGGASTFGVVTSMVIKAFPDKVTSVATFEWSVKGSNISIDTLWEGVTSYFSYFSNFTSQGLYAQFFLFPKDTFPQLAEPEYAPRFTISPFVGVGKTVGELKAAVKPWLDEMESLNIPVRSSFAEFQNYYDAFYSQLQPTENTLMPYNMGYGSRLLPSANFDPEQSLGITMSVVRVLAEGDHVMNGFQLSPTLEKGAPVGVGANAVLPAWRQALSHLILFGFWDQESTPEDQLATRKEFTNIKMGFLRGISPGAGSYANEADRLEPDWQAAFYGANYERLLAIKKKVDPYDVFWAVKAVGSEGWAVKSMDGLPTENGPLCKVEPEEEE